jgi:hypothetical protein
VRRLRRKRAREEWTVLIEGHHDGYLTWQQFLDNEAKLAANHTSAGAPPPREGITLCQGIIHWGQYGRCHSGVHHNGRITAMTQPGNVGRMTTLPVSADTGPMSVG